MVRRCCVDKCNETDLSILSHRFPKPQAPAEKWRDALKITSISLDELQKGSFVVCTKHFKGSDYRNEVSNCLNTTAIPNLSDNSLNNERIATTKGKEKQKELTQLRCHKSTPTPTPEKKTFIISSVKSPKRKSNVMNKIPLKKIKLEPTGGITIHSHEVIQSPKEVIFLTETKREEELFLPNDDTDTQLDDFNYSEYPALEDPATDRKIPNKVEQLHLIVEERSTMTESTETIHQEVQVNLDPPPSSSPSSKPSDKDDKMIKLLYPKYAGLSKMELVKILVERDLKISSLEEKEKQLEEILTTMI